MKIYFYLNQNPSIFKRFFTLVCLFTVLLLVNTSCENFLIEEPKSIAEETFYNTEKELETAINAIYKPLRNTSDGGIVGINSCLGEFTYGRGSWAALNEYNGLNDTWITRVSNMWQPFYLGIRNANLVIENAPNASSTDDAKIAEFVGEAKFLRAFAYFKLVLNWGGVPIRTENNVMEPYVKRGTESEVYELIVADLLIAEENLPDMPRLIGAPSKWAAKTLLADVYLNQKKYADARDKAKEVINSGKYGLVPVSSTDDFQKIFGPDVITTPEEIFYFRYNHQDGNTWPGLFHHPATGLYGNSGVYGVHSDTRNIAYQNWDNDDLRKGQWFSWNIGLGPTSLLSKKFIDPETPGLGGGAVPITWYRYADILMIYAEASCKSENTITTDAMEALNQVHRRAYGYDPNTSSPVDFNSADYDVETFIDLIIKERGYEFQLEGKRWPDLKRLGKAEEIIMEVKGKSVSQKMYLWPIPILEFNYNKALDPEKDQNPGY